MALLHMDVAQDQPTNLDGSATRSADFKLFAACTRTEFQIDSVQVQLG